MSESSADDVRRELEAILEQDESRVGQVYRLTNKGLTPPQIASELGVSTTGFVSNARGMARGLLEGHVPSGPTAAQQVLSFVRQVARRGGLSSEAREYLDRQIARLSEVAAPQRAPSVPREAVGRRRHAASTAIPASLSLREAVDQELRDRATELANAIKRTTDIDPVDYWAVTTSPSPLDVVVRLVRAPGEQGTFSKLAELRRSDLTLEAAVVSWADDLPLQLDLVEEAHAKNAWWFS